MTICNLLLISCKESLTGFRHTPYVNGKKLFDVDIPNGIITNRDALEIFRKRPSEFCKTYSLDTINDFIFKLRK